MKPFIFLTLGDPSGIGAEIILKSIPNNDYSFPVVVVGSYKVLIDMQKKLGLTLDIIRVENMLNFDYNYSSLYVYDIDTIDMRTFKYGLVDKACGQAAYQYIEKAHELALKFRGSGVVTGPIHKCSLRMAGVELPGHTEIFQNLCKVDNVYTMFVVENLRVFFYSRHLSLTKAIAYLDKNRLYNMLCTMRLQLEKNGFLKPKIAVAALNPHASDDGLFGSEEKDILTPAIDEAKKEGIDVFGPIPADSVFHQCLQKEYDAVLSLYHDQGHIACKTYDFEKTVSVTLGLSYIRTSVDHGTAFDIAGKGIASGVSMREAVRCCGELMKN